MFTPPEMLSDDRQYPSTTVDPAQAIPEDAPRYMTDPLRLQYREHTDIWSLGVTLYCFVHGHTPFQATDLQTLYRKIREEPIPLLINPSLSGSLHHLLLRMMERDPSKRIHLKDIKSHPWTTRLGKDVMQSTEENCGVVNEDVSEADVKDAVHPVTTKFWDRIRAVYNLKSLSESINFK
jgi:serine/threonine protein kinase